MALDSLIIRIHIYIRIDTITMSKKSVIVKVENTLIILLKTSVI